MATVLEAMMTTGIPSTSHDPERELRTPSGNVLGKLDESHPRGTPHTPP